MGNPEKKQMQCNLQQQRDRWRSDKLQTSFSLGFPEHDF